MNEILFGNIKKLCKSKNVSISKMLEDCKLNKSTVDNIKKGSIPSADKISKIAKYLNVSTDFLLTGKEKTADGSELTAVDKEVIEIVSTLSEEKKMIAYKMLKTLQDES